MATIPRYYVCFDGVISNLPSRTRRTNLWNPSDEGSDGTVLGSPPGLPIHPWSLPLRCECLPPVMSYHQSDCPSRRVSLKG